MNDVKWYNPYPNNTQAFIAVGECVSVSGHKCKVVAIEGNLPYAFQNSTVLCEDEDGIQAAVSVGDIEPVDFCFEWLPFNISSDVNELVRKVSFAMRISQVAVIHDALLKFAHYLVGKTNEEFSGQIAINEDDGPFTVKEVGLSSNSLDNYKSIYVEGPVLAMYDRISELTGVNRSELLNGVLSFMLNPKYNKDVLTLYNNKKCNSSRLCRALKNFDVSHLLLDFQDIKPEVPVMGEFAWIRPGVAVRCNDDINFLPEDRESIQEERNRKYIVVGTLDGNPVVDESTIVKLHSEVGIRKREVMAGKIVSWDTMKCQDCGQILPASSFQMLHQKGYMNNVCPECMKKYVRSRIANTRCITRHLTDVMEVGKTYRFDDLKNMLHMKTASNYIWWGLHLDVLDDNGKKGDGREIWLNVPILPCESPVVKETNILEVAERVYDGNFRRVAKVGLFPARYAEELRQMAQEHNDTMNSGNVPFMQAEFEDDFSQETEYTEMIENSDMAESPAAPEKSPFIKIYKETTEGMTTIKKDLFAGPAAQIRKDNEDIDLEQCHVSAMNDRDVEPADKQDENEYEKEYEKEILTLESATVDELLEELKKRNVIRPGTRLKFIETKVEVKAIETKIKRRFRF